MKFALLVPEEFAVHYRQHSFEISGLLNWARVLSGDILMITEYSGGYDWVMTNVSSTESEYISFIKQVDPEAGVICCFDYGFDIINQYFSNLDRIWTVMNRADVIFSVNKNQKEWIEIALRNRGFDKPIHYIPHPADTENMLKFRRKKEDRTLGVGAMWHQYSPYDLQMLEVLKAVEKRLKKPIKKTLIGLKPRIMLEKVMKVVSATLPIVPDDYPDEKMGGQPLDPGLPKIIQNAPPGIGWDGVLPYFGVEPWYNFLSQFEVCLDMYVTNSIGRFGIDCAGVGVPLVASNRQDSSKLLWPFTTVDPFVPGPAIDFVTKLLKDADFYDKTERVAFKSLHHFGFAKSRERMLRVLGEMD